MKLSLSCHEAVIRAVNVQALEDEIDALRKTYDTKGYTTDEGKSLIIFVIPSFYSLEGLGLSRSRLRLTEESSDDELGRIIRQRHKKSQKSENHRFSNCLIFLYFLVDDLSI